MVLSAAVGKVWGVGFKVQGFGAISLAMGGAGVGWMPLLPELGPPGPGHPVPGPSVLGLPALPPVPRLVARALAPAVGLGGPWSG